MSEEELSDGMEELQELIAEYETKENEVEEKSAPKNVQQVKGKKRAKKIKAKDVEVPMDKVLFGDKAGLIKNMALSVGKIKQEETKEEEAEESTSKNAKKRKPVWNDADDEEIELGDVKRSNNYNNYLPHGKSYKEFLTSRFTRIVSQPKWANLEDTDKKLAADSDDEELLRTVGFLSKDKTNSTLSPTHLTYKPLHDLNRASYAEGVVRSVQFHPSSTAALVAGESGVASIYAVNGFKNEKLHNIYFKNFPIKHARITPCGNKAIFSSGKNHYYCYDLLMGKETRFPICRKIKYINRFEVSACGRYLAFPTQNGQWHLFDAITNELIHTFQQEHDITSLIFTADTQHVICTSKASDVCIYSMKQRKLLHKFLDNGCINGNVLDLAPNQRLLATGSREGVVNVYDYEKVLLTAVPKPEKSFLNLTTAISCVKFNVTSEMLAMSSNQLGSAVRLAHFPSATVFSNFPNKKDQLGKISIMEFSPGSGYLALGGFDKKVSLFRLKHYSSY